MSMECAPMSPRSWFILPTLFVAIAAAGCGSDSASAQAESPAAPPPAPVVDVAVVRASTGTVESALEISGTLAAKTRVGIKPKLPGRLERVLVDVGDRVSEGQVLATIDQIGRASCRERVEQ